MDATVIPLDPDSDKGRETADRLSQVLAEIFIELDDAKAAKSAAQDIETQEAA